MNLLGKEPAMKKVIRSTMLDLVQAVQDSTRTDAEAVAVIVSLINSGRVVLTGSFAGVRLVTG
jgi:hypothetical protein